MTNTFGVAPINGIILNFFFLLSISSFCFPCKILHISACAYAILSCDGSEISR